MNINYFMIYPYILTLQTIHAHLVRDSILFIPARGELKDLQSMTGTIHLVREGEDGMQLLKLFSLRRWCKQYSYQSENEGHIELEYDKDKH